MNAKQIESVKAGLEALRKDPNVSQEFRDLIPQFFPQGSAASIPSHVGGIPLMTGDLGELIDKVNQHLQVIMGAVDGNARAENAAQSIAAILRSYYREQNKGSSGLFVAVKKAVMFKNEWAAVCVSNTMARRIARALNLHKTNRRGF